MAGDVCPLDSVPRAGVGLVNELAALFVGVYGLYSIGLA
jgi:hypothetical protein